MNNKFNYKNKMKILLSNKQGSEKRKNVLYLLQFSVKLKS